MNELAVPIAYEIYLQSLNNPDIDLIRLGIVETQQEAINCCKMFKKVLAKRHDISSSTIINRPIFK